MIVICDIKVKDKVQVTLFNKEKKKTDLCMEIHSIFQNVCVLKSQNVESYFFSICLRLLATCYAKIRLVFSWNSEIR